MLGPEGDDGLAAQIKADREAAAKAMGYDKGELMHGGRSPRI